jgi:hypothetical protein
MSFEEGPFIQIACFCENVIEDKTGVLSLIRVIDTITHSLAGSSPPENMPPVTFPFKTVIALKSGMARGRNNIRIVPNCPDGSSKDPIEFTVHFDGEEKGANIIVNMTFTFPIEGLYWFDIYLQESKLTSIPLRIRYNRIVTGS